MTLKYFLSIKVDVLMFKGGKGVDLKLILILLFMLSELNLFLNVFGMIFFVASSFVVASEFVVAKSRARLM